MASKGQTRSQLPRPRQPQAQALSPPNSTAAAWQLATPSYSYFSRVRLRPPWQATKATSASRVSTAVPMISATLAATAEPPARQPLTPAFSPTTASA